MLTPETLGKFAGIDSGMALVWLHQVEKANLVRHQYHWYCPKTEQELRVTKEVDEVPVFDCCHCLTAHPANICFVEVEFIPTHGKV